MIGYTSGFPPPLKKQKMKVDFLPNKYVYFTHRPKLGASVAFYPEGNKLYISVAFTYDGKNIEGRPVRKPDQFSRKVSRKILLSRLKAGHTEGGTSVPMVAALETKKAISCDEMKDYMPSFRKLWKPEHDESTSPKDPFMDEFGFTCDRDAAFQKILELANDALGELKSYGF